MELNALDGKNRIYGDDLPEGTYYIANIVQNAIKKNANVPYRNVEIHRYNQHHDNNFWIIKPDASCGLEICSPVSKGHIGIKNICDVVDALVADPRIKADERCSLHVHIEVKDLNFAQLASVLSWWLKCELVFLDSVKTSRKRNRYCQFMGICDLYQVESKLTPNELINMFGVGKYTTLNTFHYKSRKRDTIEFRIMESECCLNSEMMKNWIMLLMHFIDCAVQRKIPLDYKPGDPWTGLAWLDTKHVFEFLKFDTEDECEIRDWFIYRLLKNTINTDMAGIFSDEGRRFSYNEVLEIFNSTRMSNHYFDMCHNLLSHPQPRLENKNV